MPPELWVMGLIVWIATSVFLYFYQWRAYGRAVAPPPNPKPVRLLPSALEALERSIPSHEEAVRQGEAKAIAEWRRANVPCQHTSDRIVIFGEVHPLCADCKAVLFDEDEDGYRSSVCFASTGMTCLCPRCRPKPEPPADISGFEMVQIR